MTARFAPKDLLIPKLWKLMKEFIQVKNLFNASFAKRISLGVVIWRLMKEYTQGKSHSNVTIVRKHSLIVLALEDIKRLIQQGNTDILKQEIESRSVITLHMTHSRKQCTTWLLGHEINSFIEYTIKGKNYHNATSKHYSTLKYNSSSLFQVEHVCKPLC